MTTTTVRPATETDLQAMAQAMQLVHQQSLWGQYPEIAYDLVDLTKWLLGKMLDHQSLMLVCEREGAISAVACVSYGPMALPPHLTILYEWFLWCDRKRDLAAVWKEAKAWGKARGARFAHRSDLKGYKQLVTWEEL